jgi:DNA-nicking Smr family endonuclease
VRSLSTDEQALWERVAVTIRPLSREPIERSAPELEPGSSKPLAEVRPAPVRVHQRPSAGPGPAAKGQPLAGKTLDSGWDRRLRSGAVDPDRIIDLHGMTLDRAWSTIDSGLERAIAAQERIVLLITGHSRRGDPPVQRGRIRAAVHDWLEASRHASRIAAVRGAHGRHGGGGSLYIILRRDRLKSTVS